MPRRVGFVFTGNTDFGQENKAYASQVCHNDRDTDVCVECWGKTGIAHEKKSYASQNSPMTVTGENRYCPGKEILPVTSIAQLP